MHCDNCPWKTRNCVPGILISDCDLLIVGEGPGKEEARQGKPFVGPSGKLLRKMLDESGVDPSTLKISITNATACHPPQGEKVTSHMISHCRGDLLQEVDQARPKVILALGASAMLALTGEQVKITKEAGKVLTWNGYTLVPSLHPAAVLRRAGDIDKLRQAVKTAAMLAAGQEIQTPGKVKYHVLEDGEVAGACRKLCSLPATVFGCDIETTGVNPRQDSILALGVCWKKNKVLIFKGHQLLFPEVKDLFLSPNFKTAWHNGKFDVGFLRHIGLTASVDEDTMLMHYALNETKGTHDLEQLACGFLGASQYKDETEAWKKKGWEGVFGNPSREKKFYRYLARDCDYTYQLCNKLYFEIQRVRESPGLYWNVLLPVSELLTQVEDNGMYVSWQEVSEVRDKLVPRRDGARETLRALAGWDINPNSPAQVKKLLYEDLGLKVPRGYDVNTREETLKVLPHHPAVEALLEYREVAKALSTYIDAIGARIDIDERVHASYLIHGTATGRLSSSGPNMQNIPRDPLIRGIFQAPPGRVLLECDLDQAELRVLANLSGDESFIQIYREGRKLHHEVATEMYGSDFTQDEYIRAKAINFGIAYGRGASSLVKEFGGPNIPPEKRLTLREANRLVEAWFDRFPKAKEFIDRCRSTPQIGESTDLISPTGRRRRFKLVTKENIHEQQNEACNFPIQSTASDITLLSACSVSTSVKALGGKIVNLIHDSIMFELPDDESIVKIVASLTAKAFLKTGEQLVGNAVPFTAEFKLGTKWGSLSKVKIEI